MTPGMLFHSQPFLLAFLPLSLALYYTAARTVALREWILVACSLVFYAWWDFRFLPLLLGHVLVTWLVAQAFARSCYRGLLWLGVAVNLASLGFFKYANFIADLVADLTGQVLPRSDILLPIGISFFTFQCISYLIDMARGEAPQYPLRRFALFVALFPHLIAGPIVRHNEIIPQFDMDPLRPGLSERLARAITLFVVGFLLKVMVADKLAPHVDQVFTAAAQTPPPLLAAWAAAVAFALQIFIDFAAYSEMAIALALMMGIKFPLNFNQPYRSTSLREFWRCWHMSLSRFLRDYLYIPLGGSRAGATRFLVATIVTMGLCGLWHGAGMTFVAWGLLHGLGLLVCRAWTEAKLWMPAALGWLLTVIFVVVAFVVFRAPDWTVASSMIAGLLGASGIGRAPEAGLFVLMLLAGTIAMLPTPNPVTVECWLRPNAVAAAVTGVVAIWLLLEVGRGAPTSFIYFQF
jgi:D-alanyl-lipoteichoic acid acyltransferase DltB (MBOAT superfamily)